MQRELLWSLSCVVELNRGLAAGKEVPGLQRRARTTHELEFCWPSPVPSLLPCSISFLVAIDYWHCTVPQTETSAVLSGFPGYASLSLIVDMVFIPQYHQMHKGSQPCSHSLLSNLWLYFGTDSFMPCHKADKGPHENRWGGNGRSNLQFIKIQVSHPISQPQLPKLKSAWNGDTQKKIDQSTIHRGGREATCIEWLLRVRYCARYFVYEHMKVFNLLNIPSK